MIILAWSIRWWRIYTQRDSCEMSWQPMISHLSSIISRSPCLICHLYQLMSIGRRRFEDTTISLETREICSHARRDTNHLLTQYENLSKLFRSASKENKLIQNHFDHFITKKERETRRNKWIDHWSRKKQHVHSSIVIPANLITKPIESTVHCLHSSFRSVLHVISRSRLRFVRRWEQQETGHSSLKRVELT